jgi:hypothetical protein
MEKYIRTSQRMERNGPTDQSHTRRVGENVVLIASSDALVVDRLTRLTISPANI